LVDDNVRLHGSRRRRLHGSRRRRTHTPAPSGTRRRYLRRERSLAKGPVSRSGLPKG
jgi:hypothetical protein